MKYKSINQTKIENIKKQIKEFEKLKDEESIELLKYLRKQLSHLQQEKNQ